MPFEHIIKLIIKGAPISGSTILQKKYFYG